jgi:hypothetical protein
MVLEVGPVELMKRMTKGDFIPYWVMFDHIKRMHDWTTMGAHVYDSSYYYLLTITLCEMKEENLESHNLFLTCLNE